MAPPPCSVPSPNMPAASFDGAMELASPVEFGPGFAFTAEMTPEARMLVGGMDMDGAANGQATYGQEWLSRAHYLDPREVPGAARTEVLHEGMAHGGMAHGSMGMVPEGMAPDMKPENMESEAMAPEMAPEDMKPEDMVLEGMEPEGMAVESYSNEAAMPILDDYINPTAWGNEQQE